MHICAGMELVLYSFDELRNRYTEFVYRAYDIEKTENGVKLTYHFEIPGLAEFKPYWEFPVKKDYDEELLDVLAFSLGMTELISYWKCACPKKVTVKCHGLSLWQAEWWKKLYFNGLGEFFYVNGIATDTESFMSIEADGENTDVYDDKRVYDGVLVPVGGGKDSVVTIKVLEEVGASFTTYSVNRINAVKEVIDVCSSKKEDIQVKRVLSKKLLDLNAEGYLNGHTPFSAIVAFSSFITAMLNGMKYIALSNETSANESTVRNSTVNHQYSKSYEFEKDFCEYIKTVTNSDIHYFSLLRPLAELQIAGLFSKAEEYHGVFRSCNAGSKKGIWCNECPKCLFVYIILAPFLAEDRLVEIFGEKLLDKPSLEKYFRELTGIDENKPFECVGTRSEVMAALRKYTEDGNVSMLTKKYESEIFAGRNEFPVIMNGFVTEHNVPAEYLEGLGRCLEKCR